MVGLSGGEFALGCCGICVGDLMGDGPVVTGFGLRDPRPAAVDRLPLVVPLPWDAVVGGILGKPFGWVF